MGAAGAAVAVFSARRAVVVGIADAGAVGVTRPVAVARTGAAAVRAAARSEVVGVAHTLVVRAVLMQATG